MINAVKDNTGTIITINSIVSIYMFLMYANERKKTVIIVYF